jgi:hypothetical protein
VQSPKRIEWLHSVPAIVGVALGLIYVVGAVTIYGQLKDANLNGIQAMGVVPLEEILSRGIGQMVSQLGQALVEVGLITLIIGFLYGTQPKALTPPPAPPKPKSLLGRLDRFYSNPRHMLALMGVLLLFLLVGMPMNDAVVLLIAVALSVGMFVLMWRFTKDRGEHGPRRIFIVYVVVGLTFLTAFNFASAFLRPAPLPHVRLATTEGSNVEGALVTESGGSWYVVQSNQSLIAVTNRRVRRSFITYPHRSPEQSIVDWILGRPPSSLFGGPRPE